MSLWTGALDKNLSLTIEMKATEQHLPMALFTMLYKAVVTVESMDKISFLTFPSLKMKFLVLPDYSTETTEQHFPVLLLIYIALSRTTTSLRVSSPFGGVARGHAREARERRHDCEGRGVFLNARQAFMAGQPGISSIQII